MIKQYYYLEGREQKGPVNVDQLKANGISPDTLVWAEGMENWMPSKDIEELQSSLKKLPPPIPEPPKLENSQNDVNGIIIDNTDVKQWAIAKICLAVLLGLGLLCAGSFAIVESKKVRLKDEITSRINNILGGKSTILDGENYSVQGRLKNTDYKGKKKPVKSKDDFLTNLFSWWETEKLYSIFECTNGGFTIKKLSQVGEDSFDLEVTESGDMGYRSPAYTRGVTGYSFNEFGSGSVYGNVKTYRIPVQQYYNLAFDYYTKNDKTGTFTPGKLNEINSFTNLINEYFSIDNVSPTKATSSGHYSISWKSVGDHTGGLTWDDAKLYCNLEGKHYEIILNKENYNSDLFTYIGGSAAILLLIVVVFFILKPKFITNLSLFGKKWLNSENPNQILIFEHSFFGNNRFIDILNDDTMKGIMKVSDKGSTINLSYPNKEVFYKIDSIEEDALSLVDIKTGKIVVYKRVGAKVKSDQPITSV